MKRFTFFTLTLITLLAYEQVSAQTFVPQNSGTIANLTDVFFYGGFGTAVGVNGTVLSTANGGQTWVLQSIGTVANLQAIFSVLNSNAKFIVGDFGTIYRSFAGQPWAKVSSPTLANLYDVSFGVASGFAVGANGTILRSTNNGQNWALLSSGTTSTLFGVNASGFNVATAVGANGTILRTTNNGQTWIRQNSGTSTTLLGVFFTGDNFGIAVGLNGTILRTTNGGQTWTPQNSGTSSTLFDVVSDFNYGVVIAVGDGGTILRSFDSGMTWTRLNSGTLSSLYSVDMTDFNTVTTVGANGTILRYAAAPCTYTVSPGSKTFTSNGGASSVNVTTSPNCTWVASVSDPLINITSAKGGTGNGTITYSIAPNLTQNSRTAILSIIPGNAFTVITQYGVGCTFSISPTNQSFSSVGGTGIINVTAPNGCTWGIFNNNDIFTLGFPRVDGVGNGQVVYSLAANTSPNPRTLTFFVAGLLYTITQAGTSSPANCWTTDFFDNLASGSLAGQNGWNTVTGSGANVVANPGGAGKVLQLDPPAGASVSVAKNIGAALSGTQTLELKVRVEQPGSASMAKLEVNTNNNTFGSKKFQMYFGASMRLNNSPTTALNFVVQTVAQRWYQIKMIFDLTSNLADLYVDGALVLNDVAIVAGPVTKITVTGYDDPGYVLLDDIRGCTGGLVKASASDKIGAATDVMPSSFDLAQNYPNPFNPETTIQYAIPGNVSGPVRVTLRIYNLNGQVVRTLVDEQKSPGSYRAVWDGKNDLGAKIATGMYLYTITAGEFKATKRMTILK